MASMTRGTRSLFALAAASATALVGIVSAPTPAQSVIAGDCTAAFPLDDVAADQAVHGLTVSKGTTPDAFTGTVLGVVNDGIAPGLDMIMVRLTNAEIDRVGGIWAGMSGSPVYAEDGRLLGAVAYGLAFGPSPVAGVTPFEDMNDYFGPPPPTVAVPSAAAKRVAAAAGVTTAQAQQGFEQLPMPMSVSGVRATRLSTTRNRAYLDKTASTMGTGSSSAAGVDSIIAGGNLALTAAYGDINVGGVGTATSVCDDKVVGFGHPAFFAGKVTAALNPADAVYIQEDPTLFPFKVANLADPVGTITDDHLAGITGTFGATPDTFDVTSAVTYGARNRTGSSHVAMKDYDAAVTFYEMIGNQDRVLDGIIPGSAEVNWTINGEKPDGSPFTIDMGDRYVSTSDISFESVWTVPDMIYLISRMKGVKLDDVSVSTDVVDDVSSWKITGGEYRKGSSWLPLGGGVKAQVKAGSTMKLRILTEDSSGNVHKVPLSVDVPAKAKGNRFHLHLDGGGSGGIYGAKDIDQLLKKVSKYVRNDQVTAYVHNLSGAGFRFSTSSPVQDQIISGSKVFTIKAT